MTRLPRGFTLLELIVVIGIFAVLATMAYGGLSSVLSTRRGVEQSLDRTVALQKAYLRLRDDFQQVVPRPIRDDYGDVQPALWLTPGQQVEFTRGGWRNPLAHPRGNLQRVSYALDLEGRLLRRSWSVLDRAPDSPVSELVLLKNVQYLSWRFLDAQQNWNTEWPPFDRVQTSPAEVPPPRAVELTAFTGDDVSFRLLFRSGSQP